MSSLSVTGTLRRATTSQSRPNKLAAGRLAAFSALAMPVAAAQIPLGVYLPALLSQQFGIALSTLGLIFLAEKIWGVFADPLIGVLSDRTDSRFGRRRSWIAAGGLLFAVAIVLLFFPSIHVTPIYLAGALFIFYLAWSMIQIPFLAWSAEISGDYDERTRVATYQTVAAAVSLLLILVLPTIVDQVAPQDGGLKLKVLGGALLAILAVSLPLTLKAFPEATSKRREAKLALGATLRLLWGNPLLMRVLASDFAVTLGQSIRGALFVFVVSIYMGLPKWASGLFLAQFVFGVVSGPIWMKIGYRLGKHRTAVLAELTQVAINLGLLFVQPGALPLLLALTVAQGFAQGSGNLMLRSMVADVADQDRLRTGEDRTALFFSVFSISTKAAMAVAVGVALPLVSWLGFDPRVAVNTPQALHGLLLVFALGPALAHLVSALLVRGFPLDAQAHADIRRQLAERDTLRAGLAAE
jgi:GPH family glycoside/pentoside/hexuronide:cation symporter